MLDGNAGYANIDFLYFISSLHFKAIEKIEFPFHKQVWPSPIIGDKTLHVTIHRK